MFVFLFSGKLQQLLNYLRELADAGPSKR